jgi:arsenical-resistance protein 2
MSAQPAEQPWHAAFPAPRNTASSISREEMLQWMREGKQAGKDYVLVDLRRNDHEVSLLFPVTKTMFVMVIVNAIVLC